MLRRDLIELINSRRAWLFVGSGASVASGYPSWPKLMARIYKSLEPDVRTGIKRSGRFEKAMARAEYTKAAGALETVAGKEVYAQAFRAALAGKHEPNRITRLIADWPFEGYLTSNYEGLVEQALSEIHQQAWLSVGNTDTEIRKLARDPQKIIWHVHGYLEHDAKRSRLISTAQDYAQLYAPDSPFTRQLQGFLVARRVVFLGFGFADNELLLTLRAVGQLTPPTKPIIAILPKTIGLEQRDELFKRFNIDAILYDPGANGSHQELGELLALQNPFILRRTQEYGRGDMPAEAYDEETTGLLIYNELALKKRASPDGEVVSKLLQSKVLAKISTTPCSVEALIKELHQLAEDVRSDGIALPAEDAAQAIKYLEDEGEIVIGQDGIVTLTPRGAEFVRGQRAVAERERERLAASLFSRVVTACGGRLEDGQMRRIARIAEDFFADSIRQRAIGVANALYSDRYQDFSLTTLLQSLLPRFTERSASLEEAGPLLAVVRDVVLSPTDDERRVLGLMLQAQFAVHLLGQDLATVKLRLDELKRTLFLLDSHALMPFLAKAAPGHDAMRTLLSHLRELDSFIMTTEAFLGEVKGHIRNAMREHRGRSPQNIANFKAATGRSEATNVFAAGYYRELANGNAGRGFDYYIQERCGLPFGKPGSARALHDYLGSHRVRVLNLQNLAGYNDAMAIDALNHAARLTTRRQSDQTYKGTWQTDAEAEALGIIRNVRAGKLTPPDRADVRHAFFISPTKIVSEVSDERRVTIRIEALLQMIAVLTAWTLDEMKVLADTIFAEVSDHNFIVLAPDMVQHVFHPLEVSSRRQTEIIRAEYRDLLAAKYGTEETDRALAVQGADGILMAERLTTQALDAMARENQRLSRELDENANVTPLAKKERLTLERLLNKEKEKRRKQLAKRQHGKKKKTVVVNKEQ